MDNKFKINTINLTNILLLIIICMRSKYRTACNS